ncbi:ATP-binding protein [Streptomyces endophyticus]|uniref:Winged helix-turn-helix domain-containing protein n=1 Tax=Streptomyces endophyticus TaxID=714166 RepID=A0ABU6FB73_9ACTN|nr:BTAD domain-containing putative transcriptional regulator [Streptomyces endophyticus]MEB8341289.1 winged helix-turn-helix domain-containing protein [Streptomyces endophyticus]
MQYKILGTTQAYDDEGTPVPVGGPRLRALLTALALHAPHTAPTDALIDDVWADDPPADAPAALQALVGRLRRTLGKEAVTSEAGGYRLAAGRGDIDLYVFERLAREGAAALAADAPETAAGTLRDALALWRGPALVDLPDHTAATRHEARRQDATRARVEADLRLGRAVDLVPELRELTTAYPYDEPLHALLIRALRDSGRGADALAAYEEARRTLAEGLGADPGAELTALHAELLAPLGSAHPALRPRGSAPDPAAQSPQGLDLRAPRPRTGNLRPRLNSFVGREPELAAIRSHLRGARLVTLTGPGGSGKTRLAEEAAAPLSQAWLVELAPLDDPLAVPGAVVSALDLRETVLMTNELSGPQTDPTSLLVEHCAHRSLLLILDNCEHVIGAAAQLAETLLTRCPGLTILATSREPLGVPGESVRPVEPLPPDPAHRLFAERAAAVRPGFDPRQDQEAIAEICRRLDGLPLAIELAAARLRLLTPRQIADRLDDRFRLLTGGSRTVLPRQQTLRAVVDWSWDLLDKRERGTLCELSVFAGGWDLEAAEAVCSTEEVADVIGSLLDKSLLVAAPHQEQRGAGMRYRMLETIHEYATERAARAPELLAEAERRHIAHLRALVEAADPKLRSAEQLPWIQRIEAELDNIRAALTRVTSGPGTVDLESAIALALNLGWFWWLRNYRHEGSNWVERIMGMLPDGVLPEDTEDPMYWPQMNLRLLSLFLLSEIYPQSAVAGEEQRAYALRVQSVFAPPNPQGARFPGIIWPFTLFLLDGRDVRADLDAAVANCRRFGGDWELGVTLMFRAHMAVDMPGNMSGVDDDLAELRGLSRRVGDRWMRAQVCSAAGEAAMGRGRFEEAKGEYEEALLLAYEVGAYAESPFLMARLAEISFRSGDRDTAQKTLDMATEEAERYGVADTAAFARLLRAYLALSDGDVARAREHCDASRAVAESGTPPPQFVAALGVVDARVTAAESGPGAGLEKVVRLLRDEVLGQTAESVTAGLVDVGAALHARAGDMARAVRLFAAADVMRAGLPRSMPEREEYEAVESRARAELGAARYEAERAAGSTLTHERLLAELESDTGTSTGTENGTGTGTGTDTDG